MSDRRPTTRVGLIGHGAIGSVIADQLVLGIAEGVELVAVLDPVRPRSGFEVTTLEEMLPRVNLVVEAAGHDALASYGPAVMGSGLNLLILSVGALADDSLHGVIEAAGPGRAMLSTGAIGGIDTLRAALLAGGIDKISMTSTKPALNLLSDWMDATLRTAIESGVEPVVAFDGTAREACRLFPTSANVFATLALATLGFDKVAATLIADPEANRVTHRIEASGSAGEYSFTFRNRPSPMNPRTSAVVPWAVLRALSDIDPATTIFV